MSDVPTLEYLRLLKVCIDVGSPVLRTYINSKTEVAFIRFLQRNKHKLYHLWKPSNLCCLCPFDGRCEDKMPPWMFRTLYFTDKRIPSCTNENDGQDCLCREKPYPKLTIHDLDVSVLAFLINTCISYNRNVQNISRIRQDLCHVPSTDSRKKTELEKILKTLTHSIITLARTVQDEAMVGIIQDNINMVKKNVIDGEESMRLRQEIDRMKEVICQNQKSNSTDHADMKDDAQMHYLKTLEKIEDEGERGRQHTSNEINRLEGIIIQQCNSLTEKITLLSAKDMSVVNEDIKSDKVETDVKVRSNIDEEKVISVLNASKETEGSGEFKLVSAEKQCILLHMTAESDVFKNEETLMSAVQSLIDRIIKAGEIDTTEERTLDITFTFPSSLTSVQRRVLHSMIQRHKERHSDAMEQESIPTDSRLDDVKLKSPADKTGEMRSVTSQCIIDLTDAEDATMLSNLQKREKLSNTGMISVVDCRENCIILDLQFNPDEILFNTEALVTAIKRLIDDVTEVGNIDRKQKDNIELSFTFYGQLTEDELGIIQTVLTGSKKIDIDSVSMDESKGKKRDITDLESKSFTATYSELSDEVTTMLRMSERKRKPTWVSTGNAEVARKKPAPPATITSQLASTIPVAFQLAPPASTRTTDTSLSSTITASSQQRPLAQLTMVQDSSEAIYSKITPQHVSQSGSSSSMQETSGLRTSTTSISHNTESCGLEKAAKPELERLPDCLPKEETNFLRFCHLILKVAEQAVRHRFDQLFPPDDLQSIIQKHIPTLLDLKIKRIITSSQWNLIFPTGSVPMSSTFDMTLLFCLFRHMTKISPKSGWYDSLPPPSDTSLGADLARIKYYRNNIAHYLEEERKTDYAEFNIVWKDISEALGRIGGAEYAQKCSKLLTTSLDSSHLDIYRDLCIQQQEMLKDPVPYHEREKIKEEIENWESKDTVFVETSAAKELMKTLQQEKFVLVTGGRGTGKSFTAQHVLLTFRNTEYDIIPVNSSSDMIRYFSSKLHQIFYLDDFCGTFNISNSDIEEWVRNKRELAKLFACTKTMCIFTCRSEIHQDPKFGSVNLSHFKVIDLSELYLDEAERRYNRIVFLIFFPCASAARKAFEQIFPPDYLNVILRENQNDLRNHCSRGQIQMLFPSTGVVSSAAFDLTLILALCDAFADKIQTNNKSIQRDFATIKVVRNKIAHNVSCKLSKDEFDLYSDTLLQIIERLGDTSLKAECTNNTIYLNGFAEDSAYKELKGFQRRIPENIQTMDYASFEKYIDMLEAGKEIRRDIRLIVVGKQGSGKSSLVARLLQENIDDVVSTNGIEIHRQRRKVCVRTGKWIIPTDKNNVYGEETNARLFRCFKTRHDNVNNVAVVDDVTDIEVNDNMTNVASLPKTPVSTVQNPSPYEASDNVTILYSRSEPDVSSIKCTSRSSSEDNDLVLKEISYKYPEIKCFTDEAVVNEVDTILLSGLGRICMSHYMGFCRT